MRTNLKLKKAIKLRSEQDNLRIKALNQGVELIAPETIFLSKDTTFGKNVKIEPYVVIGSKVKIKIRKLEKISENQSLLFSFDLKILEKHTC